MTQTIIWTIAILTILGALLGVVLYVVAEKFKVEEDPRIDDVERNCQEQTAVAAVRLVVVLLLSSAWSLKIWTSVSVLSEEMM